MRILILGGNGMIGHKMYQVLSASFEDTWVLFRQNSKDLSSIKIFNSEKIIDGINLSYFDELKKVLDKVNPDVIINAAGITIRRGVNDSISDLILVNSAMPHFLEEWVTGKNGKRLIHFSTDCVFSGKIGAYTEESELDAFDNYGKSKGFGEVKGIQSLTLRGSMIGRELDYYTELLEWVLAQNGKSIKGFSKVIYSGITTVKMAEFVKDIISNNILLSGIYNVSTEPISKYDLLILLTKAFNCEVEISNDDSYVSRKDLISNKFYRESGFSVPNWAELAQELKEDAKLYSKYYKN